MSKRASVHRSVLLNETIEGLGIRDGCVLLDATFGGGGHSREILRRYPGTKVVAIDEDMGTTAGGGISLHHRNFRHLDKVLEREKVGKVDGIIFDLGFSSDQLESSGRGFSFLKDEPLLMTFKTSLEPEDLTARDILNYWSEESLAQIIRGYGEERYAKRIARAIVGAREEKQFQSAGDLVKVIRGAVPGNYRRGRRHFATRTFQALRIATNDELGALREGIEKGFQALRVGGRMAVISFHSLEDRIVKNFYREKVKEEKAQLVNKKPIEASVEARAENPRSRSAKLRIISRS